MKKFVADGTVKSFVLWNPADFGYLAAYAAIELASGRSRAPRARPSPRASSAASL
jgi:ABC-type sugar transport system substrate-binding protein